MKRLSPQIVAALFLVAGVAAIWDVASGLVVGRITLNPAVLCVFVGVGLFRLREAWRYVALAFLWLAFLLLAMALGFGLFGRSEVLVLGRPVEPALRPWVVIGLVAVGAAIFGWMYRVLTHPEIRALFSGRTA